MTLPDFIPVGESTIVQVNSMLSYYTTDEFVTSNNGIYTKTKPYEKQAQDSYSFLLKAGDSVRITLTQGSNSTEYTFVNHCAFAE